MYVSSFVYKCKVRLSKGSAKVWKFPYFFFNPSLTQCKKCFTLILTQLLSSLWHEGAYIICCWIHMWLLCASHFEEQRFFKLMVMVKKNLINVVFHLSLHSVVCRRRRPEKEVDLILLPRENCTSSTDGLPNSTEAIKKDAGAPTLNNGSKQPLITHSNIRSDSQYDKKKY